MAPALQFDPTLLLKAQGMKLVLLDVDGVLAKPFTQKELVAAVEAAFAARAGKR